MHGGTGLFSNNFFFFLPTLYSAHNTALYIILNILLCGENPEGGLEDPECDTEELEGKIEDPECDI